MARHARSRPDVPGALSFTVLVSVVLPQRNISNMANVVYEHIGMCFFFDRVQGHSAHSRLCLFCCCFGCSTASLAGLPKNAGAEDELKGAEDMIPETSHTAPVTLDPKQAAEFVLNQERARLMLRAKRRKEAIDKALREIQEGAASAAQQQQQLPSWVPTDASRPRIDHVRSVPENVVLTAPNVNVPPAPSTKAFGFSGEVPEPDVHPETNEQLSDIRFLGWLQFRKVMPIIGVKRWRKQWVCLSGDKVDE